MADAASTGLLGPADIRALASALGVSPTKTLGQNFVHDHGTVRKIVRAAGVQPGDDVLEIGPGLGSLSLAILEAGAQLTAVEIDSRLARVLAQTVSARMPDASDRLRVIEADALTISGPESLEGAQPTRLVANLPYNVSVPVFLTLLATLPSLQTATIMVQAEVADRLAAQPGSKIYGVPSVKTAWYGQARRTLSIGRHVFWPVPNVDSAIVEFTRTQPPATTASREEVFAVIDAAFAQRRKTLRQALAQLAGSPARAEAAAQAAGIDPRTRGEALTVSDFAALAQELAAL